MTIEQQKAQNKYNSLVKNGLYKKTDIRRELNISHSTLYIREKTGLWKGKEIKILMSL